MIFRLWHNIRIVMHAIVSPILSLVHNDSQDDCEITFYTTLELTVHQTQLVHPRAGQGDAVPSRTGSRCGGSPEGIRLQSAQILNIWFHVDKWV